MKFTPTSIPGPTLVDIEPIADDRGFFARTYCRREFDAAGLTPVEVQANMSHNPRAGTLRGLHYQVPPAAEAKLVRCVRGRIFDVAVDVRPDSETFLQHVGVLLGAAEHLAFYVPEGFAHGYLTLTDDVEVHYRVSSFYAPGQERGLRWDDPRLGIDWPGPVTHLSEKDRDWPLIQGDRL